MCQVSVIIPVYNCEAFLPRCLDSLKAQSCQDWEAICVNDGSKDGSLTILESYAKEDERFVVIDKVNEGVSVARNCALERVRGKYIMFVDSDDFLHPQAMEICLHFAQKDGSDMIAYTYNRAYRTKRMIGHVFNIPEAKKINHPKYKLESIESRITGDILEWATEYSHPEPGQDKRWIVKHCQPWRAMYKADRIKHISFVKGIIYEDFPWWGEVMLNTRKATIINLPLYYYYPNKRSYIISSPQDYRIESLKRALKVAETLYADTPESTKQRWEKKFLVPFRNKLESKIRKQSK